MDEFLDQVTAEVRKETKTSEFEQLLQYADDEVVEGSRVSSVDEAMESDYRLVDEDSLEKNFRHLF